MVWWRYGRYVKLSGELITEESISVAWLFMYWVSEYSKYYVKFVGDCIRSRWWECCEGSWTVGHSSLKDEIYFCQRLVNALSTNNRFFCGSRAVQVDVHVEMIRDNLDVGPVLSSSAHGNWRLPSLMQSTTTFRKAWIIWHRFVMSSGIFPEFCTAFLYYVEYWVGLFSQKWINQNNSVFSVFWNLVSRCFVERSTSRGGHFSPAGDDERWSLTLFPLMSSFLVIKCIL